MTGDVLFVSLFICLDVGDYLSWALDTSRVGRGSRRCRDYFQEVTRKLKVNRDKRGKSFRGRYLTYKHNEVLGTRLRERGHTT